jgi:hypothetical protein
MRLLPILIFTLVSLAGCSDSSPTIAPNVTSQQQASASQSMGLSFPPATKFLLYNRASEQGGFLPAPDDAVHLKVEIPAGAMGQFLAQAPFSSASWTSSRSWITDMPNWSDWQPSTIQNFRSEQFDLPNGEALNVLIDDESQDPKIVYLFWFQT